jgi:hypothetical protein
MEITNLKKLIETKLAVIDIECDGKCDSRNSPSKIQIHELKGIKLALQVMGIDLEVSINPYYPQDKKPSTYTISLEN